jgi:hypothetical protein
LELGELDLELELVELDYLELDEPNLTKSLLWQELEFGGWQSHPSRREGLTTKVKVLA